MKKPKDTAPQYVTKEILKKELSKLDTKIDGVETRLDSKIDDVEKRLESKIEFSTQSMKDYTDSRFTQFEDRLQNSIEQLGNKIDTNTAGIVDLIERRVGEIIAIQSRVDDHEKRITKLEILAIDSAD